MSRTPINLLFVVNSLHFGGAEKHVVTLLNRLDTTRFKLSLVYLKDNTELLPQLQTARLAGGVTLCEVRNRVDTAALRRLGDLIDEARPDVIVCTNSYPLAYAMLARRYARHRPPLMEVFHTTELGGWKARLQMWLYRPFFAAADLLVYVCNNQKDHWQRRWLKAKASGVIHNGIDVQYFSDTYSAAEKLAVRQRFGLAEDDLVVGLCAVMRPEKAHGDLLQAIAELQRRGIPAKALLIGDGVERANIEAQIVALGLQDVVKISGFAADVRPLIAACDAMALVSHYVETFSIAALEAMAMGKPMIMSRIGGAAEQVADGHNGFLFERGDVRALATAIEQLADHDRCTRMGAAARSVVVEKFSIDVMTEHFATTFERLQASSGAERQP